MRFPVSDGKKETFERLWYVADGFGSSRGSYFHNGADINLRTGGDSDLGERLYAISAGSKRYYHFGSHPTTGYGLHYVYKIEGAWGTRWVHYAHNKSSSPIKDKQDFPEGEWLSQIGKSGLSPLAHLHLSVFKKDPALHSRGIDAVARTRAELHEWWEDPIAFINQWLNFEPPHQEEGYTVNYKGEVIATYDTNPVDEIEKLRKQLEASNARNNFLATENGVLTEELAKQEDDNVILIEQVRIVSAERDELAAENKRLMAELAKLEKENENLKAKLEAKDPLQEYGGWELIKIGIGKIFKRG